MASVLTLNQCTACWGSGVIQKSPESLGYSYLGRGSHRGHVYRMPNGGVCVLIEECGHAKPVVKLRCNCPAGEINDVHNRLVQKR